MSERQPKAVANDTVQTTTYRRDSPCGCRTQAPSDEGAVERSETEGVKRVISNCKYSLSHFSAEK